jgi:hypothetical protein
MDIVATKGSRDLQWVTMNKDDVQQWKPFNGIEGNVLWTPEQA